MSTPQNTADLSPSISISCLKDANTAITISKGVGNDRDTQAFSVDCTSTEAIDLSTETRVKHDEIPVAMETEVADVDEQSNGEKTMYEIAAEALCLMKSGCLTSINNTQENVVTEKVSTPYNLSDIEARYAEASLFGAGNEGCSTSLSSDRNGPDIHTPSEDFQTAVKRIKRNEEVQNIGQSNNKNASILSATSQLQNSPLLSNISAPETSVQSSTAASGQPVKYVIVPESALLSTVKPGDIVSVPGTPYYFMMPKEKKPATKVMSIPGLPGFTQGCLLPEGNASMYAVSKSAVMTTVPVNFEKTTTPSDQLPASEGNSKPASLNTKISAGKRSAMKKHDTLKFPPCIICEGEASGFHYGCNTCEACKNFFRRCLLRKSETPFICHSGKTCEISFKKNKNNCSACRLDKCLEMGMAKEKCKMGRYTALMRTETIKKVRKLEGKDDDNSDVSSADSPCSSSNQQEEVRLPVEPSPEMEPKQNRGICEAIISKQIYSSSKETSETGPEKKTEYNEELIEYLVLAMESIKPWGEDLVTEESHKTRIKEHYEKYKAKVDSFGKLSDVPMQDYQVLLQKFGIDIDGQLDTFKKWTFDWETVVGRYCTFAKCIPEFRSLSFDDQACLLKATHFDFFIIVLHKGYIPEYGVFLEVNGKPFHIEEAANKFFSRELVVSMVDMMSRLQKMNLSKYEMALLISIITMSSDQCKLENSKVVEETQLQLVDLLSRELIKIYGQTVGRKRLTSLIDVIIKMREVSNIYYKEYRALCQDDLLKEKVPNLDCILPEEH